MKDYPLNKEALLLETLRTTEVWSTPATAGRDLLKKVGWYAVRPIDSRGLGQRLTENHDDNEVQSGLDELSRRGNEPEIALLGGRQILAIVARRMERDREEDPAGIEKQTLFLKTLMYDYFPQQSFDDFKLREADIASLRQQLPEY